MDEDDGRVEEVDRVLEEDEVVQLRFVGPLAVAEEPDQSAPDERAGEEEQSCDEYMMRAGGQLMINGAVAIFI